MAAIFASWQIWALLSAAFAALTALLAKIGIENVSSDVATFFRTAVILGSFAFILSVTGRFPIWSSIPGRTYLFLTLSGFATGASWLCYFHALKLGDASRVAPIDKLSVVFVAVLSVLFLGERLSTLNWFGIMLIGSGTILVAINR